MNKPLPNEPEYYGISEADLRTVQWDDMTIIIVVFSAVYLCTFFLWRYMKRAGLIP